jgi:hypothetical protein
MGARLRLKKSVNGADPALRTSDPNVQKIFRAMQRYGLIVADNGSDMYITGTFDTRWNNSILNPAFALVTASDFEVVQLGWKPTAAAPALASLGVSPSSVVAGASATGTVTLTAAPPARIVVALSSASGAVSVPPSAAVAAGATSASFAIATTAVSAQTSTSISASYAGITKAATLTVSPPAATPSLKSIAVSPTSIAGGGSVLATVTLTAAAPASGATVGLRSSSTLAPVPATLAIAAGATSATFTIQTRTTVRNSPVTISATYAGATQSTTLQVKRK